MNTLLIFFALPIATIIISIALQKLFRCPILVAAIIFAIFLIVTFAVNNLDFLVATIIYTIISFLTAVIVWLICRFLNRSIAANYADNCNSNINENCNCSDYTNFNNSVTARINVIPNDNTNGRNGCICGSYRRR